MFDEETEDLLDRFLDDRLTGAERARLKKRVADEPSLRLRLSDDRMVYRLAREAAHGAFSAGFSRRVLREATEENAFAELLFRHRPRRFKKPLAAPVLEAIQHEVRVKKHTLDQEFDEVLSRFFPRVAWPAVAVSVVATCLNISAVPEGMPLIDMLIGWDGGDAFAIGTIIFG